MSGTVRSLVLCLALVAGGLLSPTTPAHAAAPTQITIQAVDGRHWGVYFDGIGPADPHDTITVTGQLTSGGTGIPGKTVVLAWETPTNDIQVIGSTETDAEGHYHYEAKVEESKVIGVIFNGDDGYAQSLSDAWEVSARRDFNARMVKRDGKTLLSGQVNPAWGGREVVLQKRTCVTCAWRRAGAQTADAVGRFSFGVTYPRARGPRWGWRAKVAGDASFVTGTSWVLTTWRTSRGKAASLAFPQ